MKLIRKRLGLLACLLLFSVVLASGVEPGRKMLSGHVPKALAQLKAQGVLPVTNRLSLAIGLPLRDPAGLNIYLQQLYDRNSPNYHHYLTPEEFTARFGPSEADYDAVKAFARTNGFTITTTHGNRLLLDIAGPVSVVEKTFQVTLRTYRHPKEARNFFAPDTEPSVNVQLPIADISGLDNYSRPHPNFQYRPTQVAPHIGSGSGGAYLGNDFRAAYAPGTTLTGAGQTVGLVQFDGFYLADLTNYATAAGITVPPVQTVLVDGFSGNSTGGNGNTEVSLDIEMVMAMAPGLSKIVVFEGNPNNFIPNDVLNLMAASNTVKNLSSSWGWSGGPSTTTDNIFKQMAAQGQTYFNASGDSDAFPTGYVDNPGNIGAPSSSPYITQVGGTTLSTSSAGGNYTSETVWNWGYLSSASAYVGSSGGVSSYYSLPTWQQGINSFASNGGSTTKRNIPDVALTGDNVAVYYGNGSSTVVGGTSCAAPLWAGFIALVNQQAALNSQSAVGFINPAIYELANQSRYGAAFHDVTVGNNTSSSSPSAFYAVPGYDLCTGLGTPNGTNFINALLKPDTLSVTTNYGFTATSSSGSVNVSSQAFYLTNTGAASLTWSLINTSTWLNASSSGNTLAPGVGNSVVVSLTGVSSLAAGIYTATLWFSNVTSSVGHARLFTLTIIDPLTIGPTNSFSFNGPAGGPFSPASQQLVLTNVATGTLSWSIGNTSAWFNVTPASGALAAGAHAALTFTTAASATNLAAGIYSVLFNVTNTTSHVIHPITGSLLVGQSVVFNGGFETGDFTGWTLAGDGDTTNYVDNSASFITPHSGLCLALLGQPVTVAYLSQTLPTINGQKYLVSLWLNNPYNGGHTYPNQFSVSWNGATLYNRTNITAFNWTNMQFIVSATAANTVLQIGGRDDNYFLGLDDVSVTPGFAPAIAVSPTNQFVLVGSNAVLSAAVSGSTPLVYQWRRNGTNLMDGPGIAGTATNVLTLTAVTTNSGGNYSFTVTNIFGAVTSSVATLTIVLPPRINTVAGNANGSVTLSLAGSPGVNYVLESSTNLSAASSWQPVATNTMASNGIWLFNDAQVTNVPQRFYRLKYSQ